MSLEEFNNVVEMLTSETPKSILKVIRRDPTGDERIVPYLKSLLNDLTPCMIDIKPSIYAELRFLAAEALEAEYNILKLNEKVNFADFIFPIQAGDLIRLAEEAGISLQDNLIGDSRFIEAFEKLRERGELPCSNSSGAPKNQVLSIVS